MRNETILIVICIVLILCFSLLGETNRLNSILSGFNNDAAFYETLAANNQHDHDKINGTSLPISIIVQLSGEMGNNIDKIAFGRVVQLMAQDLYPDMPTQLIFRHQMLVDKWYNTSLDVKQCFPEFSNYDFTLGSGEEYSKRRKSQFRILKNATYYSLRLEKRPTDERIKQAIHDLYRAQSRFDNVTLPSNANISLPYIVANSYVLDDHIDKYYKDFQHLFRFDEQACCKAIPDPDESVFHLRNYRSEMMQNAALKGYNEASPQQVANLVYGHLPNGSKVAITSRGYDHYVQQYEQRLKRRGLQTRIIHNQTGVNDFCFLFKTQKDLTGMSRSTYFKWAAILSKNLSKAYAYTINSIGVRTAFETMPGLKKYVTPNNGTSFMKCDWEKPILKERLQCLFYKNDRSFKRVVNISDPTVKLPILYLQQNKINNYVKQQNNSRRIIGMH